MGYMRFLPKVVTVYFGEEERFDCKNNYGCSKLANFRLNNISKFNYRMLVVLSYILLGLGSRKVQLVRKLFK